MNPNQDPWKKLASAAGKYRADDSDKQAPYGFSTRVVATWRSQTSAMAWVWNQAGWRALLSAVAIAAVCVAWNYDALRDWQQDGQEFAMMAITENML